MNTIVYQITILYGAELLLTVRILKIIEGLKKASDHTMRPPCFTHSNNPNTSDSVAKGEINIFHGFHSLQTTQESSFRDQNKCPSFLAVLY